MGGSTPCRCSLRRTKRTTRSYRTLVLRDAAMKPPGQAEWDTMRHRCHVVRQSLLATLYMYLSRVFGSYLGEREGEREEYKPTR